MRPFSELTHLAGFDWAIDHHDIVVVDRQGNIVLQLRFDDNGDGWRSLREALNAFPVVAVAIETSSGPAVDRLLDFGYSVYPVQPKSAKSYRSRKAPSGCKDDWLDAWSLADALRTDGHGWKALKPEDPLTLELRLLCRDEQALIEERTAKINQLQSALHDYYPAALEAFEDWTSQSAWAFIEQFPTPSTLQSAGSRKWRNFLYAHRLARPGSYEKRMEIFGRAAQFTGSAPTIAAKSVLAVTLARLLLSLEASLKS
jgi:transposase